MQKMQVASFASSFASRAFFPDVQPSTDHLITVPNQSHTTKNPPHLFPPQKFVPPKGRVPLIASPKPPKAGDDLNLNVVPSILQGC